MIHPIFKLDSLLLALYNNSKSFGMNQLTNNCTLIEAEGWLCGKDEFIAAIKLLNEMNHIEAKINIANTIDGYRIKPDGYKYLTQLLKDVTQSNQGFVAMSFDTELNNLFYNGIIPAVKDAGFEPRRIDQLDFSGKIDDEIIVEIRKSRFMVADLTYHRPNVYYEFGYAHALGIPVYFTCRVDEKDKMHFDIQQYNCIFWSETQLEKFKISLINRIKADPRNSKFNKRPHFCI
jgi:nucleoside 2-deoxyribosyltransferase